MTAPLTDHEMAILRLTADGLSIKQIYDAIDPKGTKSISSIKIVMSRIYQKLGVPNSNAAVHWYASQRKSEKIPSDDPV